MTRFARTTGAVGLVVALFAATAAAHTYYAALTRIHHNEKAGTVEVIHALTAHDVEAFTSMQAGEQLSMFDRDDFARMESVLRDYLDDAFALAVDGQNLPLTWVGMERDDETIYAYLEGPLDTPPERITVTNAIFSDAFPDQRNRVVLTMGHRKETLLFDSATTRAEADFTRQ